MLRKFLPNKCPITIVRLHNDLVGVIRGKETFSAMRRSCNALEVLELVLTCRAHGGQCRIDCTDQEGFSCHV